MTIGPILSGRLPSNLVTSQVTDNIHTVQNQLDYIEQQLASGKQFFNPGENPTATSAVLQLQSQLAAQTQFQANLTTDQSFLQNSDSSLQTVSQAISQAHSLALSGIGSSSTDSERQAMANQVETIIQGLVNTANSTFQGRYLFGGSQASTPPFAILSSGAVRYNGDQFGINSSVGTGLVVPNNVDGVTAFGAISTPIGSNLDPAVTLQTSLSSLNDGRGVTPGSIQVTVDNGGPVTESIDLSGAKTIGDVKQLIEGAFAPGAISVSIAAGPPDNALQLAPAGGTVAVSAVNGEKTAADLGILGSAAASITGGDLNPQLTLQTALSALNGGAGISQSNGILITNGGSPEVVDISSDVTVQDLFNSFQLADSNLTLGINAAGNGLAIATRLSGVNFSIGENGGGDAASLGIRTLTGSTRLSELNAGQGVPVNPTNQVGAPQPAVIEIVRRSGTTVDIDLAGSVTVQDVLDKINAVDPGKLVASLNTIGNGISIVDNDGVSTGPLTVVSNPVSTALGIDGTQPSSDPTQALAGTDVNPIQADGIFNLLIQEQTDLRTNNTGELTGLAPLLQQENDRVSVVQGTLGAREQMLSQMGTQLDSVQTNLKAALSQQMDVDMTTAITQLTQLSTSLQATLRVAANSMKLSLFDFL